MAFDGKALVVKLQLDSTAFQRQVNAATKDIHGISSSVNNLEKSFQNLKRVMMVGVAGFGLSRLIGETKELIKEVVVMAGRYDMLAVTMYQAGKTAGYGRQEMDAFQRTLMKTGIAAIESREMLTRMAAANMDLTQSSKLARAAQDLAVVGGINSSEAFGRLTYAIQSAQVEMLRTIGLNVTFEEGYKKTARAIGKKVTELSNEEKMQSRVNIVLEAAAGYQGIYEKSMTSAQKQMLTLTRHIDDFKVALGSAFQPAYLALAKSLTSIFLDLKDVVSSAEFQEALSNIAMEFGNMAKKAAEWVKANKDLKLAETLDELKSKLDSLKALYNSIGEDIVGAAGYGLVGRILLGGKGWGVGAVIYAINEGLKTFNADVGSTIRKFKELQENMNNLEAVAKGERDWNTGAVNQKKGIYLNKGYWTSDREPDLDTLTPSAFQDDDDLRHLRVQQETLRKRKEEAEKAIKAAAEAAKAQEKLLKERKQLQEKAIEAMQKEAMYGRENEFWMTPQETEKYHRHKAEEEANLQRQSEETWARYQKNRFEAAEKEHEKMVQLTEWVAESMQRNMSDLFFSVITGEFESLEDVATGVFRSIARAATDLLAQEAIQYLFGDLKKASTGGGGGGGGAISELFKWLTGGGGGVSGEWAWLAETTSASIAHGGGKVGMDTFPTRAVPATVFDDAPRFHKGLAFNEFPAILQAGEEVLTEEQQKARGEGKGLPPMINVSIQAVDAVSFTELSARNPQAIVGPFLNALRKGGYLVDTIRSVVR